MRSEPVQKLLGHKHVGTTMSCTHVLNWRGKGVGSPAYTLAVAPGPSQPESDYADY